MKTKPKTFEVKSGCINITDPCYSIDTWCAAFKLPAKNGTWKASVVISDEGEWGQRVATLFAHHTDHHLDGDRKVLKADIGVDSGQCGIFDDGVYPQGKDTGDYDDEKSFYKQCCNMTLPQSNPEHLQWGVVKGGVVSSSGLGDGSYVAYVEKDDEGKIIAVEIVFIDEDE